MMIIALLLTCVATAVVGFLLKQERAIHALAVLGSTAVGVLSFVVGIPALLNAPSVQFHGTWYLDPFAGFLILIIGFLQWTTTLVSIPYLKEELHEKVVSMLQVRGYFALFQLFIVSMLLTVVSNNLGVMWVALEGTTLATTLLVAFYTKEGSLEAAWKYVLLCSTGISLGFMGVLFTYYAAHVSGAPVDTASFFWTDFRTAATHFSPALMKLAFVFIFLGYGAKVGFVPMHTWLPDAHGRTPSPISALLSGMLLNVALFTILRYKSLVDASLGGSSWSNGFFLAFGTLSFVVPAAFIVSQRNYKRLLAYSSIEHMGFTAFAMGLGAPGMVAALVHMLGHALTKSMLFFGTGNMLLRFKSTKIENIHQVMTELPYTGTFFMAGLFALLAIPPSPLFFSEYAVITAAVGTHPWLLAAILLAGVVIFAGMISLIVPVLFLKKEPTKSHEHWNLSHTAMALHLLLIVAFGSAVLTGPVHSVLERMASYLA